MKTTANISLNNISSITINTQDTGRNSKKIQTLNLIKQANYHTLNKKIADFQRSKLGEYKTQILLGDQKTGEMTEYDIDFQKLEDNLIYLKLYQKNVPEENKTNLDTDIDINNKKLLGQKKNLREEGYQKDVKNSKNLKIDSNMNYDMSSYLQPGEEDMMTMNSRFTQNKSKARFMFKYNITDLSVQGQFYNKDVGNDEDDYDILRTKINDELSQKVLKGFYDMQGFIHGSTVGKSLNNVVGESEKLQMLANNIATSGMMNKNLIDANGNFIQVKIDYSEDIRVMRLNRQGRVGEIFDSDEEENSQSEEDGEDKAIKSLRKSSYKKNDSKSNKDNKENNKINQDKEKLHGKNSKGKKVFKTIIDNNNKSMIKKNKDKEEEESDNLVDLLKNKHLLIESVLTKISKKFKISFIMFAIGILISFILLSLLYFFNQSKIFKHYDFITQLNKINSEVMKDIFKMKGTQTVMLLFQQGTPIFEFGPEKAL